MGEVNIPKVIDDPQVDYPQDRHVVPVNDLCEHLANLLCWCNPQRDVEMPNVIIHNSLDRREDFEKVPVQ